MIRGLLLASVCAASAWVLVRREIAPVWDPDSGALRVNMSAEPVLRVDGQSYLRVMAVTPDDAHLAGALRCRVEPNPAFESERFSWVSHLQHGGEIVMRCKFSEEERRLE